MIKNKYKRPKEKFEITVIHVFTACILSISLFAFVSDTHAAEIKTNNKTMFVHSLNACIKDLNKDIPTEKQIPSELIVAQAAIETAWGTSRIADEANNLFGIRTWNQEDKHLIPMPASVDPAFKTVWPGWGETDALVLARTLKRWAAEDHYTDLIEDVIKYNLRGKYDL
jgi:hypothetical protein